MDRNPVGIDNLTTVGLDMSLSSTGFCKKIGNDIAVETIKTKPKNFSNELVRYRHIVQEVINRISPKTALIVIEDYYTPANIKQVGPALKLVALGTLMRNALDVNGWPFIVVTASQAKKFVTGNGRADKSLVVRDVFRKWSVEVKDDNQADACTMAHLAEACWRFEKKDEEFKKSLLKYETEVVGTILKERPRYNF